MMLFLKSIPDDCYFNIVRFGSSHKKLFKESVVYNQGNLDKAVQHTKSIRADLGGTELLLPLEEIFKMPSRSSKADLCTHRRGRIQYIHTVSVCK